MDKYLVEGNCLSCGRYISRLYSLNVIKGMSLLSDSYRLKIKCECGSGGLMNGDAIKNVLRDIKISNIINDSE